MRARAARVLGALGILVLLAGCDDAATRAGVASPMISESTVSQSSSVVTETGTSRSADAETSTSRSADTSSSPASVAHGADDAALSDPAPATSETSESVTVPAVSPEVARAIAAAEGYLSFAPFSKKGLIDQLSSAYGDGYPPDVAEAAVASLDVDWKEQAAMAAANYLEPDRLRTHRLPRRRCHGDPRGDAGPRRQRPRRRHQHGGRRSRRARDRLRSRPRRQYRRTPALGFVSESDPGRQAGRAQARRHGRLAG